MAEDNGKVLDLEQAVINMGDRAMFVEMLAGFNQMSLEPNLHQLAEGMKTMDYPKIKMEAHTLKGTSSYLQAMVFSNLCKDMQEAAIEENEQAILELYPKIILQAIILKKTIAQQLAREKRNSFIFHSIISFNFSK